MANKDQEIGIVLIMAAVFFLLSGMNMLEYAIFEEKFSTILAFILVAVGIYMLAKK